MPASFVKNVGSNTALNSTTCVVTVPAAGVAAGDVLVVRMYNYSVVTVTSIVDSRSNTYTELVTRSSGADAILMWRSLIGVALQSGDTITVTFSAMANCGMSVEQFTGLQNVEDGENNATGTSTTPSTNFTPTNDTDLIVSNLGVNNGSGDAFTEDTDNAGGDTWHSLTLVTINLQSQTRGAYKITTSAVTQTYNPTLGTSREWFLQLGSLKAVADAFVPRNPAVNHTATAFV